MLFIQLFQNFDLATIVQYFELLLQVLLLSYLSLFLFHSLCLFWSLNSWCKCIAFSVVANLISIFQRLCSRGICVLMSYSHHKQLWRGKGKCQRGYHLYIIYDISVPSALNVVNAFSFSWFLENLPNSSALWLPASFKDFGSHKFVLWLKLVITCTEGKCMSEIALFQEIKFEIMLLSIYIKKESKSLLKEPGLRDSILWTLSILCSWKC